MKISMIPNKIVKLIHASKGDTSLRKWAFEPYDNNGAINVSNIKDQLVYKTENGGTEQLLPVNTSTPTTSYFDGTINYGTDTDVEFTYKQSDYTGQARIKSIKGNTLVWNQLLNSSATTSTTNGITFTNNNDGSWTISGTATGTAQKAITSAGDRISTTSGHKYLVLCGVKDGSSTKWLLQLYKNNANTLVGTDTVGNGILYTADSTTVNLSVYFTVYSGNTINQKIYPQVFDLTMNGFADNVDQFKSLFPLKYYAYNRGSLLNFNGTGIKTTKKNLFNKDSEDIIENKFLVADGEATGSSNSYIVSEYIHISGGSVIVSGCTSGGAYTCFYDGSKSFISGSQNQHTYPRSYTVPSGAVYIRLSVRKTEMGTCQLEFGSSATSYEPYTSSTLSLPISTYFPTGMKSAGAVYDELTDSKAITRVGAIDLGTLTYTQSVTAGGGYRFSVGGTQIPNIKPSTSNSDIMNAVFALGRGVSQSNTYNNVEGVSVSTSGVINIYIEAYKNYTTEQFKSAMSGVYLNYELAADTETDIQNASLVCKNIEVPCYLSNGNLVCDATEELTNESGFFDAKLKLKDSSGVAYSSKFKLHVEDL